MHQKTTSENNCECACHTPLNEQHGGLAHDIVCCNELKGTLEWRVVKELLQEARLSKGGGVDE